MTNNLPTNQRSVCNKFTSIHVDHKGGAAEKERQDGRSCPKLAAEQKQQITDNGELQQMQALSTFQA